MAPSLKTAEAVVQSLETTGVEYTIADSTITASVADAPFVIAELDEAAGTYTFTTLRPPKSSNRSGKMPTFEAGGIYNAAKRGALVGRKPSQNSVKDVIAEALAADGWVRTK
jgi:hypothetical protein